MAHSLVGETAKVEVGGEQGQGEVEIYEDDAEEQDREGDNRCDACEDGEGYGEEEEKRDDEGVDGIEQGHGGLSRTMPCCRVMAGVSLVVTVRAIGRWADASVSAGLGHAAGCR